MTTWSPVAVPGANVWSSTSGDGDDWVDPNLTLLLTESGLPLLAESGAFIATEAVRVLSGSWVPA